MFTVSHLKLAPELYIPTKINNIKPSCQHFTLKSNLLDKISIRDFSETTALSYWSRYNSMA